MSLRVGGSSMKIPLTLVLSAGLALQLCADGVASATETVYRVVPTVSSNPTSGTGLGITATSLYYFDESSSPSQAMVSGTRTDTESYSFFAVNKMFFDDDRWQSNTFAAHIHNNTAYTASDVCMPVLPTLAHGDTKIAYNVSIYSVMQQFLYKTVPHLYAGGQIFYIDQRFTPQNEAGDAFLRTRGIEDSSRFGYGFSLVYDTRAKNEKIYPEDADYVTLAGNHFPEASGNEAGYCNLMFNARKYLPGFRPGDVGAVQFYAQFSSEKTPDGALAALGARNILRGFPIGLHKARHMVALQGEYRRRIAQTRFRATLFAGFANLSGGSEGNAEGDRNTDNGNYYSGGLGLHYILIPERQLDYRINFVYTNEEEFSVYAGINQAF